MASDDYQSNWRSARRYQCDEETRREREAQIARQTRETVAAADKTNVEPFRQIKHEEPEKLKVLPEGIALPKPRRGAYSILVAIVAVISFAAPFFWDWECRCFISTFEAGNTVRVIKGG